MECYKAARELDSELFVQEDSILAELYSRIQCARTEDKDSHDVMVFWGRLNDYRERNVACYRAAGSSGEPSLTPEQAREMVENFKHYELWKNLTWKQRQSKARSIQYFTKEQDGPMQPKPSCNMDCQDLSNQRNLKMLQSKSKGLENLRGIWPNG